MGRRARPMPTAKIMTMIANSALKASIMNGSERDAPVNVMDEPDDYIPIDLEQAVRDHYKTVYRFAWHLTRHQEDAEDLTQYAYETLSRKHLQVRDPSKVKSWLQAVVHRKFIDQKRRFIRFPQVEFNEEQDTHTQEQADSGLGIDAKTVLEKLHGLDDDLRAPLILFYLESNSYKEIANILELPIGTVMSRLYRGKAMLYNLLQGKES